MVIRGVGGGGSALRDEPKRRLRRRAVATPIWREKNSGQLTSYLIKNNTQTAVINIINLRIIYELDVSYASQHTFSKVTVTI